MNLLLRSILFLVFIIYVTGKSVKDKDIPELKWPNKYTLQATKLHLVSGLVEHIKYWRSPKSSRVDYNHGAVKAISVTPEIDNVKDFGTKYEIHPQTMEEDNNEIICYYTNGSLGNSIVVEELLPEPSEFEYIGKDILGSGEVSKFVKIVKDDFMINEERTYLWISLHENNTYWFPVKIETLTYDIWLGKMASHYICNIINFEEDYEESAFSVEQYNCTENPESEEESFGYGESNKHVDTAFLRFVNEYERKYGDRTEHEMRRQIFAESLRFIQSHNQKNTTFKLGINKFSDRTPREMAKMKGLRRRKDGETGTVPFPYNETQIDEMSKKIPKQFDSRLLGVITPVEDQDTCGACWTFGTTTAVEGALARKNGGRLLRLAKQALIDCAWEFGGYGCGGGSDTAATFEKM